MIWVRSRRTIRANGGIPVRLIAGWEDENGEQRNGLRKTACLANLVGGLPYATSWSHLVGVSHNNWQFSVFVLRPIRPASFVDVPAPQSRL
jgi:hypothetical protein